MTAIRMVYLDCDGDGCYSSTANDSTPETAAEARTRAHAELGWVHRKGKDLCPDCATGLGPRPSADPYWERPTTPKAEVQP